nr:hypothetical protein [Cystobacterineae bacterium]
MPRWAGLLTGPVDGFDAAFFGVSPREALTLDPQHRLLLEVAWEAIEDAGVQIPALEGSRTGVFVGAGTKDYSTFVKQQPRQERDAYGTTGNLLSIASGRLSYTLGLQGPCLTIDTACSSSLVAIHLACHSLRTGESDLALAGGVNLLLSPETMADLGRTQALSPDGRCKTFDALANGFTRGEGCGLVVLKRLADARRDGDRIWGLVRGSAVNQDGKSTGLTAPNVLAQVSLLRDALRDARLEPTDIGFVETHGTGTSLGDPIEVDALRTVVGAPRPDGGRCVLGAVKTNVGHLESSAGVAGLVKAVLALRNERIPRNLHFRTLNPRLRLEGTSLALATEPMAWPRKGVPRRAGVSSFGISGTNAHVVLEEAPAADVVPAAPARAAELFVLSAKSPAALEAQAARLAAHVSAHPELGLGDVAFSLATTRAAMEHRLAVSATSREGLREALEAAARGETPAGVVRGSASSSRGKVAFLFTGQGAQVAGMGRGLHAAWPAFRDAFDRCVALFDRELERPFREVMWAQPGTAEAALLDQTGYTQPALFTLEYALWALWRSWGVESELLAGHSIGELVAAHVAGVFSLEDAVRLVAARGRLMQALPSGGAMMSIGATEAEVLAAMGEHAATVSVAAVNGPKQVVIAGEAKAVEAVGATFAARGVRTKALVVSHAFHSPLMEPMLAAFQQVAETVKYQAATLPVVSNVSGTLAGAELATAAYWVDHVRKAVRFSDGVKALHEAGAGVFVEVGPKATLLGMVPACLPEAKPELVASLRSGRDEAASVLEALGGVWTAGGALDWKVLFPSGGRRVQLPTYAWQRERYWLAATESLATQAGEATDHPLLGVRVPVAGTRAVFEAVVGLDTQAWLGDHRVAGQTVVPGAAIAEWVRAAAAHGVTDAPQVTGLVLQAPLVLPDKGTRRIQVVLTETDGTVSATVYSRPAEAGAEAGWTQHASAALASQVAASPLDLAGVRARCVEAVEVEGTYANFAGMGLAYGPAFQGLRTLWRGEGESLAEVALPESARAEGYGVHPALLDAALQAVVAATPASEELFLPFELGSFTVHQPGVEAAWVHVRMQPGAGVVADVTLSDAAGTVVAEVKALRFRQADREALRRANHEAPSEAFYRLEWRETLLAEVQAPRAEGNWVVVAGAGSHLAAELVERLGRGVVIEPSGLTTALKAESAIAGVVCLWEGGAGEEAPVAAHRVAVEGLAVVQALQERAPVRLWWVTPGAVAVEANEAVDLATSTAWGLGRTVAQEHPELGCTLIDVTPGADSLDALVRELGAGSEETQVAWRGGRRFATRLVRAAARASEAPVALPKTGTVLVTGGLGALGLHVARWLASEGAAHLVLTGRRGLETPGAAEAVAELEKLGARVTVAAVDVADKQALAAVLRAVPAELPLRGVIHAAGVLDDGVLAEQNAERFARVLSPKVDGAWHLHELTAQQQLDFFALFSSVSGLLGAAGQSNYAAANTFLDALAAHRRARGLPAQSLSWGAWAGDGMAAGPQAHIARKGIQALTAAEGVALLGQALARTEAQLGVALLDLPAIGRALGTAVPPVWRALVRTSATVTRGAWAARLATLSAERRAEEVRAAVQTEVAQVLALGAASAVQTDRPMQELGLDSLMAVELRNALGRRVGASLPATLAFDYPTVDALTQWLLDDVLVVKEPAALSARAVSRAVSDEPIAIVGMGCRFPGGVSNAESYWRLLDEGLDAISEVPRSRWDVDALYDPDPDALGKMTTRSGGFLSDIDQFDPAFFGISPREAEAMDPQQRLLLETTWEALERAGLSAERMMGSDTGVFVGHMYQEYATLSGGLAALDGYVGSGAAASVASGRISYVLGLKGPSLTVDTACSSSLVTVHLACQALRQGECSTALAGGVAVMLTPASFVEFSRLRGLASDGRCKSFAAGADGVGWSEGCGMLVLKRLSDAQRDGDPILALIRSSAVNQDGRSNGLTAPNGPSQQAVIRRALEQAGLSPAELDYVECHGTGTTLGDPIEVQALGAALAPGRARERPVVIGSVKSNMGHTQAAAGVAGIMKVVLSLQHARIPKSLHFDAPSPHIPWAELPVKVAAEPVEWPRNGYPRRAGVSSFGISGTNAHVVIEEAPATDVAPSAPERAAELFVLSAKNPAALGAQAARLAAHVEAHPELALGDVAFSLATTRAAMEQRLVVMANSREALREALEAAARGETPTGVVHGTTSSRGKVAFLFTGQGAQVAGMGRGLHAAWPAFREAFERCVALFDRELERPLREVMWAQPGSAEAALLDQTGYTQPALFALEYALWALWRSWGVEPELLAGHSIGELVAAHVAGVFSLEDAVRLVAARGRLMQALPSGGAMVSINATEAEVLAAVGEHTATVSVAAVNGPQQVVIAGAAEAVGAIAAGFAARGVRTKALTVSHAFHSPLMAPMLEEFGKIAATVKYREPERPVVSNVTGRLSGAELATAAYWVRHVREAVRFSDGVKALHEAGASVFVEVGPKATLLGMVPACLPEAKPTLVTSLRAAREEAASVLEALGNLWSAGGKVTWTGVFPSGGQRVLLPTYAWQRERYWLPVLDTAVHEEPSEAFYRLEWRETPLAEAQTSRVEGNWVVAAAAGSRLAAELVERLGRGVVVEPSGLATALKAESAIAGVVCLWEGGVGEEAPVAAHRVAVEGLAAVQALHGGAPVRLWWVTPGAVAVDSTEAVDVATSTAWGLGRTVAQEHPELGCTLVDVAPGADALDALVREVSAGSEETQVAWRGGRRFAARLVRAAARTSEAPVALPKTGTVLVTGGLGALGLHVARWLASEGTAHLVLTGRRGLETPGAAEAVAELEKLGARVTVAAVDVADKQALAAVLRAVPAELPLRGVIHAAGVLDDGVLAEQNAERFARVLSPKVDGAWNLHALTALQELDFFVLFSSVSGLLGAAGQSNYAAANTFLDALAAHRRARGLPAQSLAWGAWAGDGMAAGPQARIARKGIQALTAAEGVALLGQALARTEAQLGVALLDLPAIGRALGTEVPPVWRALVRTSAPRAAAGAKDTWAARLAAMSPERRAQEVRAAVQTEVARVLSLSTVPSDRPMQELGLDSLMSMELRNALGRRVGATLPVTLAFDYPTVDALTQWLLDDVLAVKEPETRLTRATQRVASDEPIAIVGMGCRFPGGVSNPESFWRLLDEGIDAIAEVPRSRWNVDALYDPNPDAPGKVMTRSGGFLSDIDQFDPAFFGISPREAAAMDPQQRLLLETSWEALARAGMPPERLMGSDTGVFVGLTYQEYATLGGGLESFDGYVATGNTASVASGRISYVLGLKGPSLTVDTACSSSLVTVHLACQSLRQGECSTALAGGVAVMLTPASFVEFSRLRGLAPDGRCKAFAADADGVGWGEGCGMIVLKRLSDAQRDGDSILAVIRGSAVNQDGRSNGLTAPNGPSQQAVIRRALEQSGVSPAEVDYVECHGTGTSLGDPIEVQALGAVLAQGRAPEQPVLIGSVKSNVGHTQAAAGVASIMKVVLSLQHGRIPKSLHFDAPSPHIPWAELPVKVAAEAVEWPRNGHPRLAGVSSFGISGTNAHVVIEEAPETRPVSTAPERAAELMVLSARSAAALDAEAAQLAAHLDAHPELGLSNVAFSLTTTRSAMEHRLAVAAASRAGLRAALQEAAQGQTPAGAVRGRLSSNGAPKVVFVFPGQGSQWLGMGRQLLAEEPVFRATLEACDKAIQAEAGWSLLKELAADEANSQLARIDVVQPVLFAIEVALAALWRAWGVEPDAVVGHSMGEVAAAHVAGALSLEDAVAIICRRSLLLRRISGQGEMALVELSRADAEAALVGYEDRLSVAVSNSPRSTVVAGDPAALAEVLAALEAKKVFCRRVKVDVASHSPQVDPLREDLLAALSQLSPKRATVAMRSTVTGEIVGGEELVAGYWADNLRQPVRFADAVQELLQSGHGLFIEMSPHPILTMPVEEIRRASEREGAAVGSLRRGQGERGAMLEALGTLWVQGHAVAWERQFPAGGQRVSLPTYPWQRERYWIETPAVSATGASRRVHTGGHPLLGEAQAVSTQTNMRLWETMLDVQRLAWLGDHRVQGAVVLPGAAYLEMALSSGAEVLGDGPLEVTHTVFAEALAFAADAEVPVQVVTTEEQPGRLRFQVASQVPGSSTTSFRVHSRGALRQAQRTDVPEKLDVATLRARLGAGIAAGATYARLGQTGLEYGPAFQGMTELWQGDGEALGRVRLPEAAGSATAYRLHPALLDACFHVTGGVFASEGETATYMPVEVGSLRLWQRPAGELWCYARRASDQPSTPDRRSADLRIVDGTGMPVAEVSGLVVKRLASDARRREEDDWFLELAWETAARPSRTVEPGRWLLLGGGELGARVRAALEAAGHAVEHVPVEETSAAGLRARMTNAFGGQAPTAVVHLGGVDASDVLDAGAIEAALVRGSDSVLATVQAIAGMGFRDAPRLWVLTRGAQAASAGELSVGQAPLLGLCRVIAMEHSELRCASLDLDPARPDGEVEALVAELLADDAEDEVAFRGGERRVARLVQKVPEVQRRERVEPAGQRPFRLEIDRPGVLDHLVLRGTERRPPGPGEVEIAVETAGLNFLDVLLAMGVMPNDTAGASQGPMVLGGECAGRIVAMGEGVEGLEVGQAVIAFAGGAFASHVTTAATYVLPRPTALSAVEAAAMPVAYLTAWYALDRVARLQRGERVLIHAATGGVGLAAVQWARHVGAEVYATAGTPEKRAYLESLGVKYVSDSRSDRFVADVREWTGGEGVDVVLNSLSGELITKSFDLLRDHGRFVELGKRDYYANNQLGLQPFLRNLSFSLVDLRGMLLKQAARVRALFQEVLGLVEAKVFTAPPIATLPIAQAPDAFRKMAQAQHLGKLVLTVADTDVDIHVPAESRAAIRADGSYLVTGGLGGLGLSVAGWLAGQGARHLVLVGRSGVTTPEQQSAITALEAQGARVTVAKADVAERVHMERVLAGITASGMPLRGVIHAAGLLDDGLLVQQTPARLRKVMAPKVQGALHLHELTREMPLDFFVLYSSGAGLLGAPGQGNYAAANTFLDALAHHRRAQGLPALSIDWGSFSEVGLAAAQENRAARMVSRGVRSLSPDEGLTALARLLDSDRAQAGVVPLDIRQWIEFYPAAASSRRLSHLAAAQRAGAGRTARSGNRELLERLAAAEPRARASLLQDSLGAQVAQVLRLPEARLDLNAPLTSLGMDSLMGLELRNRIEATLGITVPATLLWTYPTVAALGEHVLGLLSLGAGTAVPRAAEAVKAKGPEKAATAVEAAQVAAVEAQVLPSDEPIAIVGMGCRFPGGADSPEAYWELLENGRDAVQPLDARWQLVGARPSEDAPRWAGLLTGKVDAFDAAFFGISPREAQSLDPQQRLLLEVAWEALEDANILPPSLSGSRTGVFVGAGSTDYLHFISRRQRADRDAFSTTGNMLSIAAGRLSYTLGLQGPSLTLDTACSSSLVSLVLACRSLRARESDLALAGGVSMLLSPDTMEAMMRTQALSPEGRCRTFDAAASGFVRGEGCGLVVLKRLSDARRDGDRVLALIRGSAVNQDGRSTGLTTPNVLAQEALLREALQSARVDARAIGYVETHGTGTSLGDPIEIEALRAVVGPERADGSHCVLGAVKTNLGHLEAAAGVAGLIKAVLVLQHERIPKNLNFRTLNPRIRLEGTALALATEPTPWPRNGTPRLAGVSAFGLSGTNAHVVLEEAPAADVAPAASQRAAELFVLSAKSPEALEAQAAHLAAHVEAHPEQGLGDMAFSLATTRAAMEQRLAVVATSREELREALEAVAQGQTSAGVVRGAAASSRGGLAFLFTGQGAQVAGMGRGLHATWPAFRDAFDRCVALFDRELERPLREVMWAQPGTAEAALLDQTGYTQPALFALEYALWALWRSWGVEPELLAGHSIGELVAAHVAGVFSLEDAVRLVAARGRLMQALPSGGAMVSIGATEAEVLAAVGEHAATVSVAAVNGPKQVVIAGETEAVGAIAAGFAARGVRTKALTVSHAFHSPLMEPMLAAFQQVAESVKYRAATLPVVSNVTGALAGGELATARYWVDHVRKAVRFSDGVQALHQAGASLFVEVGPKATLLGLVPACLPEAKPTLVASLRTGREEAVSALEALGSLWSAGGKVAWAGVFPSNNQRVRLPTYAWQRERHWIEMPVQGAAVRAPRVHAGGHPLLGEARTVSMQPGLRLWETTLDVEWLRNPGSAFLEMALAAGAESLGEGALELTGVVLSEPLTLTEEAEVQVAAVEEQPGRLRFQVASLAPGADKAPWRVHCNGTLQRAVRAEAPEAPDTQGEGEAPVRLPELAGTSTQYRLHPALLAACIQAAVRSEATWVPAELGSLRLWQRPAGELWCHVRSSGPEQADRRCVDLWLVDGTGARVLELGGMVLQRVEEGASRRDPFEMDRELLARLATATPAEQVSMMASFLRAQVAQVLRLTENKLDLDAPLASLGMDSLLGLELRNRLEARFGFPLPADLQWQYPTIASLVEPLLEGQLRAAVKFESHQSPSTANEEREEGTL